MNSKKYLKKFKLVYKKAGIFFVLLSDIKLGLSRLNRKWLIGLNSRASFSRLGGKLSEPGVQASQP